MGVLDNLRSLFGGGASNGAGARPVGATERTYEGLRSRISKSAGDAQPASRQLPDEFATLYAAGMAIEPPYDPERLLVAAETNEVHSACLLAKATDSVGRGWEFTSDDEQAAAEPKDAVVAALEDICPDYTFQELLLQAAWELVTIGYSGWEVVRNQDKTIGAAYPIPAHTLRATRSPDIFVQVRNAQVRYFKRFGVERTLDAITGEWLSDQAAAALTQDALDQPQGSVFGMPSGLARQPDHAPASELITFRRYSPRSTFYGMLDYIAGMPTLAEYAANRDYNISFYETAGVMSKLVFLSSDVPIPEVVNEIDKTLKDARGRQHTNMVAELPGTAKVQVEDLAVAPREQGFKERRLALVKSIMVAHSVPPYRIGYAELGSLGGSAASEMMKAYRHGVVEPIQTTIEHRLGKTLFGPAGYNLQGWAFTLADLDWEETELSLKIATESVKLAILSPNEARAELGRDPDDDPNMDRKYMNGQPIDTGLGARSAEEVVRTLRGEVARAIQSGKPKPQQPQPLPVDTEVQVPAAAKAQAKTNGKAPLKLPAKVAKDDRPLNPQVPTFGQPGAKVVLVGLCPGSQDVDAGSPMSGYELDTLVHRYLDPLGLGLNEEDVAIVMAVPEITRDIVGEPCNPTDADLNRWQPWLHGEIRRLGPGLVVALGDLPRRALGELGHATVIPPAQAHAKPELADTLTRQLDEVRGMLTERKAREMLGHGPLGKRVRVLANGNDVDSQH